jgi:uroporphyrinogen-III synthase
MQNKIVITRPFEDSTEIAQEIESRGFVPLIEPVLDISDTDEMPDEPAEGLPLIFTSANAVRAFAKKTALRSMPVYTVGRNTADEARLAGYTNVESASGTAEDLTELLLSAAKTGLTEALYVRGRDVSVDLKQNLTKNGLKIAEFVAYQADPMQKLSISLLKSLDNKEIKAVMLFSVRGAKQFSDLIEQYDRTYRMKSIKVLCISNAVLESCSALPFGGVLVADKPDRYGMIRLLEKLATAE